MSGGEQVISAQSTEPSDDDAEPGVEGPEVIVVSFRGPVTHHSSAGGRLRETASSGGLVAALLRLPDHHVPAVWICAAMTPEDNAEAMHAGDQSFPVMIEDRSLQVRMVRLDEEAARLTSTVAANPVLWFVQHSMWDPSARPGFGAAEHEAFDAGYAATNEAIAKAVADELDRREDNAVVMLHDYHLYLVPSYVRALRPQAFLHHFVHVPWPAPDMWRTLPTSLSHRLLRGLLANDIVSFHTEGYVRNFLATCDQLLGLPVDHHGHTVAVDGRTVDVRWHPASVDPTSLRTFAARPEVAEARAGLQKGRPAQLVVRVDRADPTKNIVRGFLAFEHLLLEHPEHRGSVVFLALIQPTRQGVPEYREYLRQVRRAATRVNHRFGSPAWEPVDLRVVESLALAVAAYQEYDVLFVNPIRDGMNLVAKEGVLLNERDGILVLSDQAGAYEELGAFAVGVHPQDLLSQTAGLHRALTMSPEERHERAGACRAVVERNDACHWLDSQMLDVAVARARALAGEQLGDRLDHPSRTRRSGDVVSASN